MRQEPASEPYLITQRYFKATNHALNRWAAFTRFLDELEQTRLPHPDFEIGDHRPQLITTYRKPSFRRFAGDGRLDLQQDIDASHGLVGNRGFSRFRQVGELSAAVASTGRKDWSRLRLGPMELVLSIEGMACMRPR